MQAKEQQEEEEGRVGGIEGGRKQSVLALEVFGGGGDAMAVSNKPEKSAVVKRPFRTSFTMKRTNDWVLATDVPSDVVVIVGGVSFALHKFPLVSRCGRIRMLVVQAGEADVSQMELPNVPGGSEGFDMAARFCYGINFEITTANVAVLRCAAEYLEMTEEYGDGNLVARTEAFLNEVVCQNLADSITVLHHCENLLPWAEELKIVSRTIDAIASKACREQIAQNLGDSDYESGRENGSAVKLSFSQKPQKVAPAEWWAEDLAVLRIDFFQRVLSAMRSRGLRYESIGGALMHYAQRTLKGLHRKQGGREMFKAGQQKKGHDNTTAVEHEQRILVETIVSLLPSERNTASCSFLFGLLRTAIVLDTTIACRLDLERRIGQQLEQATLDDLLIPSFSYTGDTLFDVDIVQRIIVCYLQQNDNEDANDPHTMYESDGGMGSPTQSSLMKVAKLLDSYLAEIAPDANLKLSKFITLAEILPEYARVVDDGLYRAIDIYLKAHPSLVEVDRKKLCKLMDVQKLSQEACTHAAQNERLPVQIMVQVLYFEQLRLRAAINGSIADNDHGHSSQRINGAYSSAVSPRDNYASVRRENRELKLEVARMRMRLTDLEKDHVFMKQDMEKGGGAAGQKTFLSSVSKKLTRFNPFAKAPGGSGVKPIDSKEPNTPDSRSGQRGSGSGSASANRRRRHSIS